MLGLLVTLCCMVRAEDAPATQPPQIEPVDFIDNARPQQSDPTNRRATATNPTGWGFATFSPDSKTVATVSVPDGTDSMSQVTQSIGKLIDELEKLPGIGRKSAERLAYH